MKKILKIIIITISILIILLISLIIFIYFSENRKIILPVKHKILFTNEKINGFPEELQIEGNKIINKSGNVVTLKGVNIISPGKLHSRNMFNKTLLTEISDTEANVIRIPVDPEVWLKDKDYIWRYLDPAINWAGELGMYVIIDLHFIGNIMTGEGKQMPNINIPPIDLTNDFWKQVASHYKDVPNVLFEIYNEPANIKANEWRECAVNIVDIIRNTGANQIVIVSGTEYSRDLSWALDSPVIENNIAYSCHIYPGHSQLLWSHWFGELATHYPVIMTEWGFIDEHRNTTNQDFLIGDKDTYGIPLLKYLEEKNIGWLAWSYDDKWEPQMFTKGFKGYTNFGEFVIEKMGNLTTFLD